MSNSDRWLLPDGVADVLPPRARRVETLRRTLLDQYQRWGYELIIPPLIEYLQSLLTGTGNDLDLQTFKLTDQLTGRMMGVRADMTPQAARMDAHSLRRGGVTRLCYAGHVLHARPNSMLASRTPLQVGCELFGSTSRSADQEILDLMLGTLQTAGVARIHLDLAHVGIFQCLAAAAGLGEREESRIFDAMRRKSIPELDELLGDAPAGSYRDMLRNLARLNGGARMCPRRPAGCLRALPDRVLAAVDELDNAERCGSAIRMSAWASTSVNYAATTTIQGWCSRPIRRARKKPWRRGRYDAVGEDFRARASRDRLQRGLESTPEGRR